MTEADILPDTENNRLTVRVHNASRPAADRALEQLLEHLNNADVKYPGTDMKLVYQIGGIQAKTPGMVPFHFPRGKEF